MSPSQGTTAKFECTQPDCNKDYERRPDLQRHEQEGHGPPYSCLVPGCFYTIKRRDKFITHMMDSHGYSREYAISILEEARGFTAYSSLETPGQATIVQQRGPMLLNSPLEHITVQTQQPQATTECDVTFTNQMMAHPHFVASSVDDIITYPQNGTSLGVQGIFSPSTAATASYDTLSGFPAPANSNSIQTPNSTETFYCPAPFENETLDDESVHFG